MKTVSEKLDDLRNQQIHDYCDRPWFADEDNFVDRIDKMVEDMKKEEVSAVNKLARGK